MMLQCSICKQEKPDKALWLQYKGFIRDINSHTEFHLFESDTCVCSDCRKLLTLPGELFEAFETITQQLGLQTLNLLDLTIVWVNVGVDYKYLATGIKIEEINEQPSARLQ